MSNMSNNREKATFYVDRRIKRIAAEKADALGRSLSQVVRDALLEFAQKPVPELLRDDLKE